jgi:hypothetical protein
MSEVYAKDNLSHDPSNFRTSSQKFVSQMRERFGVQSEFDGHLRCA